ncbi:MAG: putative PEP-binding protein [Halioglobus sp.]|nr:putative PEP-binding protein [Halioglobus sp.]
MARIAAAQYPNPVIVRMSDFKTNEYAELIGGAAFEPHEENPMLGFGAAPGATTATATAQGFALECRAIARLREEMGFDNVVVMIPFCRSIAGGRQGARGDGRERPACAARTGLRSMLMAEIPSNVILAERVRRTLRRLFHRLATTSTPADPRSRPRQRPA